MRAHLRSTLGALIAGLALVALANLLVDPFGVYPAIGLDALEPYRRENRSRTYKAEMVQRLEPSVVILGSSRAEIGYDPEHPAITKLAGQRSAINASLAGTNIIELMHALDRALGSSVPETVILCVDFVLFADTRRTNQDFAHSRFDPDLNVLEYHIDNTLSLRAWSASRKQISMTLRDDVSSTNEFGFREGGKSLVDSRKRFEETIASFSTHPEQYAGFVYTNERPALLDATVASCRARGIDIIVIINPIHLGQLVLIEEMGLQGAFEQMKRDVAKLSLHAAHVIDLAIVNDLTTEPMPDSGLMEWWYESSHFNRDFGDLILANLIGGPDRNGLGIEIDSASIDGHLTGERAKLESAKREHASFVEWVLGVSRAAREIE